MSGAWMALASALLWAISSVLLAYGVKRLHVLPLNLLRCAVSTLFFWALLPFFGGPGALSQITWQAWLWLLASVLALLVVGDTLYFLSLDLAGVSWAMPVAGINPLWSVLLAFALLAEPLSWKLLGGAALVVAGIVLIGRPARGSKGNPSADPARRRKGMLLALAVSLIWAVGLVALKPGTEGIDPVVANSVRQLAGFVILLGLSLRGGRWRELGRLSRRSWAILLTASLVGTGVGSLLFVGAVQAAGAGRTAVLTATAPMLAVPFSALWLGERPTRWTLAGTMLTTLGIALVA